jgi:DNA-binding transcriptional ArsR family regulator
MTSSDQRIADPQRIRALAHPLRLQLIDVLGEGPATATRCAELTGESVASCSFHLRMLAKYGYIEAPERIGRQKPWKLTSPGLEIRPDDDDPDAVRAGQAMAAVYVDHAFEQTRRWVVEMVGEPDAWTQASTVAGASVWATVDELAELSETLQGIADRLKGRSDNPSARPEGARPVRIFGAAHVDVAKEARNRRVVR